MRIALLFVYALCLDDPQCNTTLIYPPAFSTVKVTPRYQDDFQLNARQPESFWMSQTHVSNPTPKLCIDPS